MATVLGLDLGGTKVLGALVSEDGRVLARERRPTPAREGPEAVVEVMAQVCRGLLSSAPGPVLGLGIGAPGPIDLKEGVVVSPPNLAGWERVPLQQLMARAVGLPVYLHNDASAAALGEYVFGFGRGVQHLVYLGLGTGIGGGIVAWGRLYGGSVGAGGELGHMSVEAHGPACKCGNHGCLEAFAGGWSIALELGRRLEQGAPSSLAALPEDELTAERVFQAARQGDVLSREVIGRAAFYLGIGLSNLINIFNPEVIAVGGSLAREWNALVAPAIEVANARAMPLPRSGCRVLPARLGDDSGVLGAAALVLEGGQSLF